MGALHQLCSSGNARPQTVRPLLHLLLTPNPNSANSKILNPKGPEVGGPSLSPAVLALRKMTAAPESHAIVVSEAVTVLHAAGGNDASAAITDLLHTLLQKVSSIGCPTDPAKGFPNPKP